MEGGTPPQPTMEEGRRGGGAGRGLINPFPASNLTSDRSGVMVGLTTASLAGARWFDAKNEADDDNDYDADDATRMEQYQILDRLKQLKLWQDKQQTLLAEQQKLILMRLEEERQSDEADVSLSQQKRQSPQRQQQKQMTHQQLLQNEGQRKGYYNENEQSWEQQHQHPKPQEQQHHSDADEAFTDNSVSDSEESTESVESGVSPLDKDAFYPELTDITEEASVVQDCTSFAEELAADEDGSDDDSSHPESSSSVFQNDSRNNKELNGTPSNAQESFPNNIQYSSRNNSQNNAQQNASKNKSLSIDDVPIITKVACDGRSFEELVEMQLSQQQEQRHNDANEVAAKRPFLRRGEGLERFSGRRSHTPSSRRPSISSATSSGYQSASSHLSGSSSSSSHPSKLASTINSISPPPSTRSTTSSQPSTASTMQQKRRPSSAPASRVNSGVKSNSTNKTTTTTTAKQPKLTDFHKKIVEKEKQEKTMASTQSEDSQLEVKSRKVASLNSRSSPSLLPTSLRLKREQLATTLSNAMSSRPQSSPASGGVYLGKGGGGVDALMAYAHTSSATPSTLNSLPVAQPSNTSPPHPRDRRQQQQLHPSTPSASLREFFETSLEKSIQKRCRDKRVEESVERKEIEEFELLEQLAVAVGSKDHERVHKLLEERESDTNNNNRKIPFNANSYRSIEEGDEEEEEQDTDVEGSLSSDAELFGEGTESADDVTLTGVYENEETEMDAVNKVGNKLNDDIRKFLSEGGASSIAGDRGASLESALAKLEAVNSVPSVDHTTTATAQPNPAASCAASASNDADDAITFDDETVWDQNSGGFSFADFADDSCLEAVKNVSSSTPTKGGLAQIIGGGGVGGGGNGAAFDRLSVFTARAASNPQLVATGNSRAPNLAHVTSDILSGLFPKPQDPVHAAEKRVNAFSAVQEGEILSEFKGRNEGIDNAHAREGYDGRNSERSNGINNDGSKNNNTGNNNNASNRVVEGELSNVVKVKLMELEREIEEFKSQNDCLSKLRREKEEAVASLKAELAEFQREKSEEIERMEEFKESESKRLKKDRKAFEEMQRIAKEKSEKRESEEIKCLNSQIEDLQEELQKRSARWASASTRLREKISVLNSENAELKEEIVRMKEKAKKDLLRKHTVEKINPALLNVEGGKETKPILKKPPNGNFQLQQQDSGKKGTQIDTSSVAKHHASLRGKTLTGQPYSNGGGGGGGLSSAKANSAAPKSASASAAAVSTKAASAVSNSLSAPTAPTAALNTAPTSSVAPLTSEETAFARGGIGSSSSSSLSSTMSQRTLSPLEEEHETVLLPQNSLPPTHQRPIQQQQQQQQQSLDRPSQPDPVAPPQRQLFNNAAASQAHISSSSHPQPAVPSPLASSTHTQPFLNSSLNSSASDSSDIPTEETLPDGSTLISYRNGTRKTISAQGLVTCAFFNGDEKTVTPDGTTVYFYALTKTRHSTSSDGTESLQFDNGQTEISYPDGTKEVRFPDGTVKRIHASGNEDSIFPDGTVIHVEPGGGGGGGGRKVINFPNGQKEIHEKDRKSRSYPDGTVKIVFEDGTQETNYASGRRRVKDKDGNVLVDTMVQR